MNQRILPVENETRSRFGIVTLHGLMDRSREKYASM